MNGLIPKKNMPFLSDSNFQLYDRSAVWISDFEFIRKEIAFFRELLVNYVLDECSDECYKKGKLFLKSIDNEIKIGRNLSIEINEHKMNLGLLIEKIYLKREDQFRMKHLELKEKVENYVENYACLKEQLFLLILKVLRLKKENIQC